MAGPSIHICRSWNANEWSFLANMSAFVPPTYIFHTTASKYLFPKIAIKGIWSHCIEKQYIWKEKFKAEKMRSKAKAIVTDIWQPSCKTLTFELYHHICKCIPLLHQICQQLKWGRGTTSNHPAKILWLVLTSALYIHHLFIGWNRLSTSLPHSET